MIRPTRHAQTRSSPQVSIRRCDGRRRVHSGMGKGPWTCHRGKRGWGLLGTRPHRRSRLPWGGPSETVRTRRIKRHQKSLASAGRSATGRWGKGSTGERTSPPCLLAQTA